MDTRAVLIRTTCFHLMTIAMIAVWDCGADCPQPVSNLRWICASKLQGVVSERFARCERKKLRTGLDFQPLRGSNRSSGYRMRSERIEIRRNRSEEHTSELQSLAYLVCRLLLEKKKILIY